MQITLRYFDGCPNWTTTDRRLVELVGDREDTTITRHRVESAEEAQELRFPGSPTILIDDVDPFAEPLAPVGLACRVYRADGAPAGAPSLEQLRIAIDTARGGAR
ncbi:thioredoxin family protein [Microbacterium sp. LRZ72]|uniref:thioredoxin family protein n=1 Tax=Microbacterium sp. LRZ72 TaxID=2942481 RepID=UPI0029BC48C7|nr:thioredoxin family protein [Microbacterium sp. LRZ72]MDX2377746.1 thioredoxin family protein [Microbacterium sp. LRZ72]